jgi:hypothetical protein
MYVCRWRKGGMDRQISAVMKFRKKKFRYGIPAYTGPFRAPVLDQ